MRKLFSATAAMLALGLAAPAFAGSSSQQNTTGQQKASRDNSASQSTPNRQMASDQKNLINDLRQAGYKNVTVLDSSYLVQAQMPNGHWVLMTIDPPGSGVGMTSSNQNGANNGSGSSGSSGSNDQGTTNQ
jgi:hypothetical protein